MPRGKPNTKPVSEPQSSDLDAQPNGNAIAPNGNSPNERSGLGAAAALQHLERREYELRTDVDKAQESVKRAREYVDKHLDDDDAKKRLQWKEIELKAAEERHLTTSKTLLSFDKSVTPEKREGAQHPQSAMENWVEMFFRYQRLAVESAIMSFSQDATTCNSAQEIYQLGAERIRDAFSQTLDTAVKEQKLPLWLVDAARKGL